MTERELVFRDVILAIEAKRGDIWGSSTRAVDALDELENDIREIAKTHGVSLPEPS